LWLYRLSSDGGIHPSGGGGVVVVVAWCVAHPFSFVLPAYSGAADGALLH
jgi:hypothetical protein